MLPEGDLRSDGRANEVAGTVVRKPKSLRKLAQGLSESDEVIRARTAHTLEKISRTNLKMLRRLVPTLIELADRDQVPMVRWHIAMMSANMKFSKKELDLVVSTPFRPIKD